MVEVRRRPGETTPAMIRRFNRRVQKSGVLVRARKERFFIPKPSKRKIQSKALRRDRVAKEREKLAKLGKLVEERTFGR